MKKFEKARALLSSKLGKPSYEAVLETALDEFLAHNDPERRKQRREASRNEANAKTMPRNRAGERGMGIQGAILDERRGASEHSRHNPATPDRARRTPIGPLERSRHIPAATRDAVFKRDRGRCAYVGSAGKRCGSTHNLQIDHVVPYARGGTNTIGNLRLLCARHNKLEAERVYGANAMRRFSARE
jgi:5-methylcytosine-specific restriction endonuclease McrA